VGCESFLEGSHGDRANVLNDADDHRELHTMRDSTSGRFTDAELMREAIEGDAVIAVGMFAQQLDQVQGIYPRRFEEWGFDALQLNATKDRFGQWAAELRVPAQTPTVEHPVPSTFTRTRSPRRAQPVRASPSA
jgi:hypothetical protein